MEFRAKHGSQALHISASCCRLLPPCAVPPMQVLSAQTQIRPAFASAVLALSASAPEKYKDKAAPRQPLANSNVRTSEPSAAFEMVIKPL